MDRELQDKSLARRLLPSPARSPSNPRLKKNCIQRTFAPMEVGSLRAAIFTYCSSIIGAGVLSIPYAMHLCGLGLGIIMLIAGALIFTIFYWVLCDCCDHLEIYDYDALV